MNKNIKNLTLVRQIDPIFEYDTYPKFLKLGIKRNSKADIINKTEWGGFIYRVDMNPIINDDTVINGAGVNFNYNIDQNLNIKLEYSKNIVECGEIFNTTDPENKQCGTTIDDIKISLTRNISTLDNEIFPVGNVFNIVSDISLPIDDWKYYTISIDNNKYIGIKNKYTLKLKTGIDIIDSYNNGYVPFHKRTFGGGNNSVRGFEYKTMGPQHANDNAVGGNISLLGSISISGIPNIFDKKTRLDFFIDTGNIYENISDICTSDIGISAGVEYTYKTFIGEIGFNIAKVFRNTNKKEKDKTKLWSFVNK